MVVTEKEKQTLTVGVVENDPDFCKAFTDELASSDAIESIHVWESAETFWRDPQSRQLDLLFLDIHLPGMTGVDLATIVSERDPEIRKIMLTNLSTDDIVYKALKAGALGFILKSELQDIHHVIQIVSSGGAIITPTVALRVMHFFAKSEKNRKDIKGLTAREKQILEELSTGATPKVVGETLSISIHTVRAHIKKIYSKLNVANRGELLTKMKELGYL